MSSPHRPIHRAVSVFRAILWPDSPPMMGTLSPGLQQRHADAVQELETRERGQSFFLHAF